MPLLKIPAKDLIGKTTIPELIAILSKLSFLLTNDSGILHMGDALKIPLVALFGPTVRGFGFAPYRPTSKVVEMEGLKCRPCSLHGDDQCPLRHHKCMDDIDLNRVLNESWPLLMMGRQPTS
jgi:heptosyltransferase-2